MSLIQYHPRRILSSADGSSPKSVPALLNVKPGEGVVRARQLPTSMSDRGWGSDPGYPVYEADLNLGKVTKAGNTRLNLVSRSYMDNPKAGGGEPFTLEFTSTQERNKACGEIWDIVKQRRQP